MLKVKRGFVGSINVKVPWTKLGSQSVVITVREVYLTVEPQYRWDKEDLAKMEQQAALAKLEQLEIGELVRQQQNSMDEGGAKMASSDSNAADAGSMSWTSKLMTKILMRK